MQRTTITSAIAGVGVATLVVGGIAFGAPLLDDARKPDPTATSAAQRAAVAAALAPRPVLLWSLIAVIAIEAIVVWVIIWMPSPPDALGRATAMLALLLVVAAAAVVLSRVVAGPNLRLPRMVARVAYVGGVVFLAMGWAMILTDGEALPGRVLAGVAIIYATSALAAVVIALMRSYTVVRRT